MNSSFVSFPSSQTIPLHPVYAPVTHNDAGPTSIHLQFSIAQIHPEHPLFLQKPSLPFINPSFIFQSLHHLPNSSSLKMEGSKTNALLVLFMLCMSFATPILGCSSCGKPAPRAHHKPRKPHKPAPKGGLLPPIIGPIINPPVTLPPVTLPPIKPPVILPPIVPVLPVPPVLPKPPSGKPCPPPPGPVKETCPIDTLKLGACVDLLGGLVHVGLGNPVVNECCPILSGLVELEAAVCLCTTLKVKLLNLKIFVPLALQLLVTCGKSPPPGYTCTI